MLRPSPNHGTQRLPNDDDDDEFCVVLTSHTISHTRKHDISYCRLKVHATEIAYIKNRIKMRRFQM